MMLHVEGLTAGYGAVEVLHGIDLEIPEGGLVAVVGANGAGKSTLMQTICGVHRASGGTITFEGFDITRRSPSDIMPRGIALVPENRRTFAQHPVEHNLRLGGYVRRSDRKGIAADLEVMYERFPILHERRRFAASLLSGGEQQMLAIAMALMSRPRLLMLDEPSLGLAPIIVEQVFDTIRDLKAQGTTIVLNEQYAAAAVDMADKVVVMKLGVVVFDGTPAELKSSTALAAAYL